MHNITDTHMYVLFSCTTGGFVDLLQILRISRIVEEIEAEENGAIER